MAEWQVHLLSLGRSKLRGPQGFWNSRWDEMIDLAFISVLAIGPEGQRVLVNTSPPEDTIDVERLFPAMRYLHEAPRGDLVRTPDEHIERALARHDLTPADIDLVILTPLELYTTGTLARFTRAKIAISQRGWFHFHSSHAHPHDKRWRKFPESTLVDLVTTRWDDVVLLDDEHTISPGLRTWWAGAHHRESLAVEFDTRDGVVTVTDAFFYLENLATDMPIGLCESLEESSEAMRRIRATAAHVVPIHDPEVLARHTEGWGVGEGPSSAS